MGRRAARREATVAEILDAAWSLARSDGLLSFSLRDLAAKVGMQAPSLYQYFPSKDAIYDAMFRQGALACLAAVGAEVATDDRREALRQNGRRMFDFATSDPVRAQLLFQRTIPGFEPSAEAYSPAVELVERVRALMAGHGITDPDAMDLWTAMIGGLIAQQLSNDPGGSRWARLVDRTVDMFIAEIGPNHDGPHQPRQRKAGTR
jgi:AcrR family transcriptional regulator